MSKYIKYEEYFIFSIIGFFIIDIFGMIGFIQIFSPIFIFLIFFYLNYTELKFLNNKDFVFLNKNRKISLFIIFLIINTFLFFVCFVFIFKDIEREYIENLAGTIPISLYFIMFFSSYYYFKQIKKYIVTFFIGFPVLVYFVNPGLYGKGLLLSISTWEKFLTFIGYL